ncbi:MAG: pentapeptide repeat-containing protein [Thomasclavelia ramosa]
MIESLTYLDAEEILALDLNKYRQLVNPLLQEVYCQMNKDIQIKPLQARKTVLNRADFMGCDLHEKDLRGQDFNLLIGANLSNCDLCGVNF